MNEKTLRFTFGSIALPYAFLSSANDSTRSAASDMVVSVFIQLLSVAKLGQIEDGSLEKPGPLKETLQNKDLNLDSCSKGFPLGRIKGLSVSRLPTSN